MTTRVATALAGIAAIGAALALAVGEPVQDVGEVALAAAGPAPTTATGTATVAPSQPPTSVASSSASPPAIASSPGPAPDPESTVGPTPSPVATPEPARLSDLGAPTVVAPVTLRLPALDLVAPIAPMGVREDGQMEIPEDVDDTGWYRHGPTPGDPGNAIIAGHVDDREQGLGTFHRLVDLRVGDEVAVDMADGTTTSWRVTGRRLVDKDVLPVADLFRREGIPQLVLVTCGGEFDGSARSYRSNVVVVAQRV